MKYETPKVEIIEMVDHSDVIASMSLNTGTNPGDSNDEGKSLDELYS